MSMVKLFCVIKLGWVTLFNPPETVWLVYRVVTSHTSNVQEFIHAGRREAQEGRCPWPCEPALLRRCMPWSECQIWVVNLELSLLVSVSISLSCQYLIVFNEHLTNKNRYSSYNNLYLKVSQPLQLVLNPRKGPLIQWWRNTRLCQTCWERDCCSPV